MFAWRARIRYTKPSGWSRLCVTFNFTYFYPFFFPLPLLHSAHEGREENVYLERERAQ